MVQALLSPTRSARELSLNADQQVDKRLQRVEGVARVEDSGLASRELRIDLDPARLRSYAVTLAEGGLIEAEDRLRLGEQVILQGLAVLVERVRGPVQAVQIHRLVVVADQLTERRALLQPGVRGQLAAGVGHAANDVAHGGGDLHPVQAQFGQLVLKPALAHRRQRRMLHAHAAWAHQIERVEIDLLIPPHLVGVGLGRSGGREGGRRRLQRNQLRGVALRQGLTSAWCERRSGLVPIWR